MRTLLIASALAASIVGGSADAQRIVQPGPGANYPVPGRVPMAGPGSSLQGPTVIQHRSVQQRRVGQDWGSKVGGRWWGGANAPGGWSAYRRPYRGWALPRYWVAPRFYVTDWAGYGLAQPPRGYNWARYYDDAVLIDARGSVYDTVDGLDWDGYGDGDRGDDLAYAGADDRGARYERRDDGIGGAAIGAVAGGVAGNVIAGRGNRLGGTLIGAGVGAAAGYAIDKSEDRGRRAPPPPPPPPPGYPAPERDGYRGDRYPPVAPHRVPPPPPGYASSGSRWVSPDGTTTVVTTGGGYYPGASTTVVTVQTAPVLTTTTTEIYEDSVTYTRPVVRKTWRKRTWRPKPRCSCR